MQYQGLRRTTDATVEPVTAGDALWVAHSRLRGGGEEALINMYLKSARKDAEKNMGRALISQSWTLTLDRWPGTQGDWWEDLHNPASDRSDTWVELPNPPLISITSVNTYDVDDVATPITVADVFYVDTNREPGRLCLRSGQSWPSDTRLCSRIEIIYKAGYGTTVDDVPEDIRLGIMQHGMWEYEHRGAVDCGNGLLRSGAEAKYAAHRIWKLA
jgi:hypothetical protein